MPAQPAGARRGPGSPVGRSVGARGLPAGFTAMPGTESGPNGFPEIHSLEGGVPAALGLPNTTVQQMLAAGGSGRVDVFQQEWIDACRGKHNHAMHGTRSKTNCDFDYSGTMMEQMLLGLVAHGAGKKLTYAAVSGRVTNAPEGNDSLKRTYRANWTLDG